MSRAVDLLLDHLRAEQARGVEHVYLDEEAREVLRDLHRRTVAAKKNKGGTASSAPTQATPARSKTTAPARPREAPAAPPPAELKVEGATAAERVASLKAQAENWQPARAMGTLREKMVFSVGDPEAELMLVGEAPGHHEERQGEPFVGPAGQKLNDILKAMGVERTGVYISNIVKFRPAMPKQTSNNRKPTPEEMAACLPFVREEVKVVRPKCIVALGGTAAEGLLGLSGSVGAMRGKWHEFDGIPVRVTYHPAYLLHGSAALGDKRKIWEDMLEVMEMLGLPISDKQRGFFLPKG
ncbi:uracil-DNA glycosylase family protein [Haloferula sp. A504]|uniref:uracil-DNA glycosylase family protein n=1 Tax=Haloferula sp. A504 TaxID=3373601 RepID=UPI0031CAD431|nr:uracil-DNA glycosylase [Verrucomicrobiaceae bacterium E54]